MKKLFLVCALFCLYSNQIIAKCEPSVGKHIPTVTPPNYYGNSHTDSFNCAVTGSDDLSLLQQKERAELIPQSLNNRFYLRMGFNAASESLSSVKNKSIGTNAKNGFLNQTQVKTASNNIEIAFGYTWTDLAIDIEWLGLKSMTYNSSLQRISPVINFTSSLRGDAYLANLYGTFYDAYNFKFYGIGVVGFTNNKTTTQLSTGQPNNINKKYAISFGAGIGMRFNVISSLYADMAGRYLLLGKAKFEASAPSAFMSLKSQRTWLGLSVRLLWLI